MKLNRIVVAVLMFSLVALPCLLAQAKQDATTGEDRLEGTIQSINKDTSTFFLKQTGKTATWQIAFDKNTKFTLLNKEATVAELKEGLRVICLGKFGETTKMMASRIDVRTQK